MSVEQEWTRPLPIPDETTAPFWEATKRHELVFQRCQHCRHFAHLPVSFCPSCNNVDDPSFAFERVSGRGTIVNWTVIHDHMVAGFEGEPPINHVLVRMAEQDDLFFPATLIGDATGLALDAPVVVVYRDITEDVTLPYFELATS